MFLIFIAHMVTIFEKHYEYYTCGMFLIFIAHMATIFEYEYYCVYHIRFQVAKQPW